MDDEVARQDLKAYLRGDGVRLWGIWRPKLQGFFGGKIRHSLTQWDENLSEDLTQEVFMNLIRDIQERPDRVDQIQNIDAWVWKIAENVWKDHLKASLSPKRKAEVSLKRMADDSGETNKTDEVRDPRAAAWGSKGYCEIRSDDPARQEYEALPKRYRDGLEKSVEMVAVLFGLIKVLKANPAYYRAALIHGYYEEARTKSLRTYGNLAGGKFRRDQNRLKELERKNPETISENEEAELRSLRVDLELGLYSKMTEWGKLINGFSGRQVWMDLYPLAGQHWLLINYAEALIHMRSQPARLLYEVWSKALRKGRYANREQITWVFRHFKKKFVGTNQHFLFASINENLPRLETIRKSQYEDSRYKESLEEAAEYIFRSCFRPGLPLPPRIEKRFGLVSLEEPEGPE